ncbi:thioredoxin domain-containing protein 9-like [Eurytemora carolleeae]|uniref:thioredoxin domain-containing protein 9-like n=1 Tax=Eurytemora carolleeae TaxID=1294199 RepID=UPI000C78F770|nr:thioredoxin domain-containing protein 9-like [Eurytemora carolleeae]|eukprot:XP_023333000.1 thioredoxin domain-containing protein 9-like [Eurytemora affinis]
MAGNVDMGAILSQQLINAARVMEEQVDDEIKNLEKLDEDDLEAIKRRRLEAMKNMQKKKAEWMQQGHGEYSEIPEEKEFFNITKNSQNVVCHFYREETFRCKILDKHLNILAKKHLETKFCKINAEKCPFLCDRLKIKVIPTVILIKDAQTRGYVVGFSELGNTDEFSTEMLEWRIAQNEVITYSGDLMTPPDDAKKSSKTNFIGKKVKGRGKRNDGDSSDENDW